MNKNQRILLFTILMILLSIIYIVSKNKYNILGDPSIIIFASLIMLSFVSLFLEHFFTSPTDVIASTISILLLLSPLKYELSKFGIWYNILFFYNLTLLIISITALLLLNTANSSQTISNKLSYQLKKIAIYFGNGKFLFFSLFIITMLTYIESNSKEFLLLFSYSSVVIIINPKKYFEDIFRKDKKHQFDIGEIFGVQSKNTFLAKLYEERLPVRRHDFVEFRYSMSERQKIIKGLIIDNPLCIIKMHT